MQCISVIHVEKFVAPQVAVPAQTVKEVQRERNVERVELER